MRGVTFGRCLLVSFPIGIVIGAAFGASAAGLFDHDATAHVEPMKGLIVGGGMTLAIGLGGALAARFNLR